MLIFCLYILTGIVAGGLSGLLGVGGGIVIVPALAFIFSQDPHIPNTILMHLAAGTSLATMLLITQASIRAHYRHTRILWPIYRRMALGLFMGTALGVGLAVLFNTKMLMLIFGIFLLILSLKMLLKIQPKKRRGLPGRWKTRLVSLGIGSIAGLLGISGGTLTIPFFEQCRLSLRKTTSVVALSSATVALTGTLFCMLIGEHKHILPSGSVGYVYWPAVFYIAIPSMLSAPFFARLAYRLPVKTLKMGFIVFLFATSIHMLMKGLTS